MLLFEWIVPLLIGAVTLAGLAKRLGVPYPAFLALGGAALALLPAGPNLTLEPDLALALFVAPIIVDTAYDASLRDLKANWLPITLLVLAAVGVTTLAVAAAARAMVPDLPWGAAIALGAIVAPPDATAATAVLRQVRLPPPPAHACSRVPLRYPAHYKKTTREQQLTPEGPADQKSALKSVLY